LSIPPRKCQLNLSTTSPQPNAVPTAISYSRVLQAQATCTQSIASYSLGMSTTITQISQTVLAIYETQFQTIKHEVNTQREIQQCMHHCLLNVESQTKSTSENIPNDESQLCELRWW